MSVNTEWIPPAYLVIAPNMIPDESDEETSEGEDDDGTFTQDDFKNPPFIINWKEQGTIHEDDELVSTKETACYLSKFVSRLLIDVGNRGRDSHLEAQKRVGFVIGHTRMRSISSSVNSGLEKQAKRCIGEPLVSHDEIHFFWRPQWINSKTDKDVSWAHVHHFYRQLKKKNLERARLFRNETEGMTEKTEKCLNKFFKKRQKQDVEAFIRKRRKISFFSARHVRLFDQMLKQGDVKDVVGYTKLCKKKKIISLNRIKEEIKQHPKTRQCAGQLSMKRPGASLMYLVTMQNTDLTFDRCFFFKYDHQIQEILLSTGKPLLGGENLSGEKAEIVVIDKKSYCLLD